jgi:recombinational DNA repair ATPase RecF
MKLECHCAPKKGSWLDMAEIEISALSKQCLDRRIGNIDKLAKEIAAWEQDRNEIKAKVRWQFNRAKAREKLHRHYISVQN